MEWLAGAKTQNHCAGILIMCMPASPGMNLLQICTLIEKNIKNGHKKAIMHLSIDDPMHLCVCTYQFV